MWLRVSICAWSPPQDAHKSIAPERGVLAHLTLDCFFSFFFLFFSVILLLKLNCCCTGEWRPARIAFIAHCTTTQNVTRRSHILVGLCRPAPALRVVVWFLIFLCERKKRRVERKLGKLETILDCYNGLGLTLSFIRAFTYTIFLFLFFKISHLASMNLLLVVELVDCGGEETTIHGRPKIASYWLASIHLALGWDRRERGEENEGRMRIIRYGFGVRWGSSRELAWLRMRASFTGDEQSRVVGPIFALPCPACDISIENNWIKKRRQKKRNWRRMREISLSGNQQEQWEMRKE